MREGFYFPHFQDARRDIKIMRLRRDLGIEGYGIYFMLLEVLREQPNFKFPLQDIEILVSELQTTRAKIEVVILNYGLFETEKTDDGQEFFSPKQIAYLLPYIQKKENAKLANMKSQASRKQKIQKQLSLLDLTSQENKSVNMSVIDSILQIKEKEKEKKRKEIKEEETTTEEFCSSSFFTNEEIKNWIIDKSKDKVNPSAYAATMIKKIKENEPNAIAELNFWTEQQKKQQSIERCLSLKGKTLLTGEGEKIIMGVERDGNEFKIYFENETRFATVSTLEQLKIIERN